MQKISIGVRIRISFSKNNPRHIINKNAQKRKPDTEFRETKTQYQGKLEDIKEDWKDHCRNRNWKQILKEKEGRGTTTTQQQQSKNKAIIPRT